jgi:hypothetical protein
MTDTAISAIANIPDHMLNFKWLRSNFGVDRGLKDSLDFGHAVLDTPAKLDQYLYSYGLMIKSQWEKAGPFLAEVGEPAFLIDYGCGQGLAGLLASDLGAKPLLRHVHDVLLIEPSNVALARAAAIYRRLAPAASVSGVCKRFDAVLASDLPPAQAEHTLHLFSNSLDITGFDPIRLLTTTLRPGRHTILSVSADRNFRGGTSQIESVKAGVEIMPVAGKLTVRRSETMQFTCDNPSRSPGFAWLCQLEVLGG